MQKLGFEYEKFKRTKAAEMVDDSPDYGGILDRKLECLLR
jgi:hypothetical protein